MAKPKKDKPVEEPKPELSLEQVENNIVLKVVEVLSPELNKSVNQKFEEMKNMFMNELKDIRSHFDQPQEQPQEVSMTNLPQDQPQQQPQVGNPLMDMILPLALKSLGGGGESSGNSLGNLFQETIMRKALADLTRNDTLQDAFTKAMYKKLLGEDLPDSVTNTTDKLMNPLRKFGDTESSNK